VSLQSLASSIKSGGCPGSLGLSTEDAVKIPAQYLNTVVTDDIAKVDDKVRDEAGRETTSHRFLICMFTFGHHG